MVHQAAASGFDRAALAYERGRPSYPELAIEWLVEQAGLSPTSVCVDLAAGTGKLTRALVALGPQVIAVEPVGGMRRVLMDLVPRAAILHGTAEDIPLPTASVDLVSVGQAFHWFDVPAALAEMHRVLRSGGNLALVWNRRLLDGPIHREVSSIIEPHRGATPSHHRSDAWMRPLLSSPLFEAAGERSSSNVQRLDEDGLVDLVLSTSFIATLTERPRQGIERGVRDLARRHGGSVALPYSTDVQLFRRSSRGGRAPAS